MRTIIDLPEENIKSLDLLGKKQNLSRAELVRRAVSNYLEIEQTKTQNNLDSYFGLFKDDKDVFDGLDGLGWQEKMREEWDDRDSLINQRQNQNTGLNEKPQEPYDAKPSDKKE